MPNFTTSALTWLQTILQERFGHAFTLIHEAQALVLTLPGSDGSIRFDRLQAVFHQSRSDFPCHQWQASVEGYTAPIDDRLPAPSETALPNPLIGIDDNAAVIHYDILGLTYWMLTRLEEVGRIDLDNHQRFPATSSHAYQHGYLERPIVDEWLNILGQIVQRIWPQLKLKEHRFSIKVSHDVDVPSRYGFRSWGGIARAMAGDLINRGDVAGALRAPWIRLNSSRQLHPADPANTFDWLMDVSDRHGLTSAFYFICGRTEAGKDADYEPEHPAIRNLMRRIHARGHEIGLHPSYGCYQRSEVIVAEAVRLRRIAEQEGISQTEWGGRMHYLRWEQPTTLNAWAQAGMTYDSTLSYADRPGFRCGTCFEYPAYDPVAAVALGLRIRPLVVMECTVMAPRYMGLGTGDAARIKFLQLKRACKSVGGCFTLLWHNSQFESAAERVLYESLLA